MSALEKRKNKDIAADKIIIRGIKENAIAREKNVYEMELQTRLIRKATLEQQPDRGNMQVFKILEKTMHVYLPALNASEAKVLFNLHVPMPVKKKR